MEKENYNDIGTPLNFRQEKTSESRRSCNANTRSENRRRKHKVVTALIFGRRVKTSETQRCDNIVTTLSDVATKIQPKPNVVTTSCASWESLKLAHTGIC